MSEMQLFYEGLMKPVFAPPADVFGVVWAVLYILIATAGVVIFLRSIKGTISPTAFGVYAGNIIANVTFTSVLLSFGLLAGLGNIIIILGTLVYLHYRTVQSNLLVFLLLLPYTAWVSFAFVLQAALVILN